MKYWYRCLVVVSLLFLFANHAIRVSAMNTGFSTAQLSEEEKSEFISIVDLSFVDEEPTKRSILCFDINPRQIIAIGQDASDKKMVCVYSEDVFQYAYTFNCIGDFGIEWDENNINIYFVRSDMIISVTPTGEIVDVNKVENTIENNSYRNHYFYSNKKIVGDTEYTLQNNMGVLNIFSVSYAQLIATKSSGEEILLYDVHSSQLAKTITVCICVAIAFLFVVVVIRRQFIKLRGNR